MRGPTGDPATLDAMALKLSAQLFVARGDGEAARKDLDEAIEIFERIEGRLELGRTLVTRGENEDLVRARDLFQSCCAAGDLAHLSS